MKMIKCDRCGKVDTVSPMPKNFEFPIIKITKADDIFQSVTPREIDLCRECREELDGWLKERPIPALYDSLKQPERVKSVAEKIIKEMAENAVVSPPPQKTAMQDAGIDVLDDLISAYHKGIESLYHLREEAVNRVAAATGETKQETAVQRH